MMNLRMIMVWMIYDYNYFRKAHDLNNECIMMICDGLSKPDCHFLTHYLEHAQ